MESRERQKAGCTEYLTLESEVLKQQTLESQRFSKYLALSSEQNTPEHILVCN